MPAIRGFVLILAAAAAVFTSVRASLDRPRRTTPPPRSSWRRSISTPRAIARRWTPTTLPSAETTLTSSLRARKGKIRAGLRIAEFELARVEAETLVGDAPQDAEAQTLLGDAMWANGLFDESDAAYREAIALAPESSRAHFGLARSMTSRSQLEEALKEALPVAAAAPQDPEIHALDRPDLRAPQSLRGIRRRLRALHRAAADDGNQHDGDDLAEQGPPAAQLQGPRAAAGR